MEYKQRVSNAHKELLERASQYFIGYGKPIIRACPFPNDDVPKFLKRLDECEKKSRLTNIVINA